MKKNKKRVFCGFLWFFVVFVFSRNRGQCLPMNQALHGPRTVA